MNQKTGPRSKRLYNPEHYYRNTMSTLNVKIPDEMDEDLTAFLEANPHYLNKSELVRDAIRHLLESQRLSTRTREDIRVSRAQIAAGETVSLDELE